MFFLITFLLTTSILHDPAVVPVPIPPPPLPSTQLDSLPARPQTQGDILRRFVEHIEGAGQKITDLAASEIPDQPTINVSRVLGLLEKARTSALLARGREDDPDFVAFKYAETCSKMAQARGALSQVVLSYGIPLPDFLAVRLEAMGQEIEQLYALLLMTEPSIHPVPTGVEL